MYTDFKVYESSKVERLGEINILQGENNINILRFALPETIRGYNIANFTKEIKFESEKGEVLRFRMDDNQFAFIRQVTRFKSVLVQLILTNSIDEKEPIVWRTIPFKLDFIKSINAVSAIGD